MIYSPIYETKDTRSLYMNITNAEMTQATIEIFGGFICLMLAVIIMMNGNERDSWKWLKRMLFSTAGIFFAETCAYIFRGNTDGLSIVIIWHLFQQTKPTKYHCLKNLPLSFWAYTKKLSCNVQSAAISLAK